MYGYGHCFFIVSMFVLLYLGLCEALPAANSCSQPPVSCDQNPCDLRTCISFPTADCVANYCGGCFADFYFNGELVDPYGCENIII